CNLKFREIQGNHGMKARCRVFRFKYSIAPIAPGSISPELLLPSATRRPFRQPPHLSPPEPLSRGGENLCPTPGSGVLVRAMNIVASLFNLAGPDVVIILLVVLLLFGAKRLPELARGLGQ